MNEATNGQFQIKVVAGGTLGGESDTLDMAIQGDLDIASCANSVLANYIPEMSILDQAFLWDSQDQANYAVRNELGDLIQEKANAQGIHVIGYMESGFRDVFSKKPIQTMADFNGVKIRTMQNDGQLLVHLLRCKPRCSGSRRPVHRSAAEHHRRLRERCVQLLGQQVL